MDHDRFPTAAELDEIVASATAQISALTTTEALRALEADLLGRRSLIASWKKLLGSLPSDERRSAGQVLNDARVTLEAAFAARADELDSTTRLERLVADRLDLSEVISEQRPGHLHLLTKVRDQLEDVFLGMGYEIAEGPEVESEWYNFTALNMPRHHSARSIQDSFYLDIGDKESWLLRSQTSPVQIRLLERGVLPIYAVAPGRVFRRDTPDARHLPIFHQMEGMVVDEGVTFADMAGTIATFITAIFGDDVATRLRPAYFPFTEPSAELEITCTICRGAGCRTCSNTGWVELGGCGMVHPAVFEATGVDPERWSGFAFGFGIDRLAFMRHEFEDLRSLTENDIRFLTQF
jgi:phenylalanyl-tRNA synthetase alpha chain